MCGRELKKKECLAVVDFGAPLRLRVQAVQLNNGTAI